MDASKDPQTTDHPGIVYPRIICRLQAHRCRLAWGGVLECQGLAYLDSCPLRASQSPRSLNQTSFSPPAERSQGGSLNSANTSSTTSGGDAQG
jgi:hypothetical protein